MIEIVFDEGIAANLRVIIRQSRSETEKLITFMNEREQASDAALVFCSVVLLAWLS